MEDYEDSSLPPPRIRRTTGSGTEKKKKHKRKTITANLVGTRYEVVRQMAEKVGFSVAKDDDWGANLIWNDSFVSVGRVSELKPYQKMNHFPGMNEITRKDSLARNISRMQKNFPDEYDFVPKTWILPTDYNLLTNYSRDLKAKKKQRTFIVKPSNGAQGHGISLHRNAEKISQSEQTIVQEYIDKPLLLDGFKFDLRVYVLVTSCDPLRIFLFNDGLVRLCTEKYLPPNDNNTSRLYMHLTNYSINKHSDGYERSYGVDSGSKRSIRYLNDYLRRNDYDITALWTNISEMIVKTLIVAQPHILHAYRMCRPGLQPGGDSVCFEILGFDFMIDRKCRPWLIEINRSPSFGTDEKIDFDIKSALVEDSLRLLNIKVSDKRKNMANQKAESQKRLFRTTKRGENNEMTELEKRRNNIIKKKEELKEQLKYVRKATEKEDYENRNLGRFRRIFPSDDQMKQDKYCNLLLTAFSVALSGRGDAMQKEIQRHYSKRMQEEDILDKIEQCEADEKTSSTFNLNKIPPRARPVQTNPQENGDSKDDNDFYHSRNLTQRQRTLSNHSLRRPASVGQLSRPQRSPTNEIPSLTPIIRDKDAEMTHQTLLALNEMRIKFPGKSDAEADRLLDKLHENMKYYKPRIASYWLVKLDSIKRRKVIDIVRTNVRAVLQKIWKCSDVDALRIFRIFSRVFNRLLWSHGQGLWNCFAYQGNSWESLFCKSSDMITEDELNSCRRVVQLCKDCLLIVYQFATEANEMTQKSAIDA